MFMETWYGGGLGRAQGGYDEMVFRAMVRDDADFYDPLGLVSKGTEVDFQTGANAYLYGTRFLSYLALEYSPEKLIDWLRRTDGTERYYARTSNGCSASRWRRRGRTGCVGNTNSRPPTSRRCGSIRSPRTRRSPAADSAPSPAPT